MKEYNIIEAVRLFVMKAQTDKALEELYSFLNETRIPEVLDQLILLSSTYNDIQRSEQLGLGTYLEEKNRINLSLLKIISQLEEDKRIKVKPAEQKGQAEERLHLIESKLDFLLNHVERNDDILFYGFYNSALWKALEPSSQEQLTQANIIEKEGKQDQYNQAITLMVDSVETELEKKFFSKFREKYRENAIPRNQFMDSLKGMNKDKLYKNLTDKHPITLKQASEILLKNVFYIEKGKMNDMAKLFYSAFFDNLKVKYPDAVIGFFKKYHEYDVKGNVGRFTQTLVDLVGVKEDVIHLFINLQPLQKR